MRTNSQFVGCFIQECQFQSDETPDCKGRSAEHSTGYVSCDRDQLIASDDHSMQHERVRAHDPLPWQQC